MLTVREEVIGKTREVIFNHGEGTDYRIQIKEASASDEGALCEILTHQLLSAWFPEIAHARKDTPSEYNGFNIFRDSPYSIIVKTKNGKLFANKKFVYTAVVMEPRSGGDYDFNVLVEQLKKAKEIFKSLKADLDAMDATPVVSEKVEI